MFSLLRQQTRAPCIFSLLGGRATYATRYWQPYDPKLPSTDVYMGNLPFTMDVKRIEEEFARYNPRKVRIGIHNKMGTSLGYAVLRFDSVEAATRLVEDSKSEPIRIGDRELKIGFADFFEPEWKKSSVAASQTLWVYHVPPTATEQDVRDIFEKFGPLKRVTIGRRMATRKTDVAYAHVQYFKQLDARKAVETHARHTLSMNGNLLKIDYSKETDLLNEQPSKTLFLYNFEGNIFDIRALLKEKGLEKEVSRIESLHVNSFDKAFIHMMTVESAEAALAAMNGCSTASGFSVQLTYARLKRKTASRLAARVLSPRISQSNVDPPRESS